MTLTIEPYDPDHRDAVFALSMRAWAPVFADFEPAVASYVYRAFYPDGWQARQSNDIASFLDNHACDVWIAREDRQVFGWVGVRLHHEDAMGEVYILAVDPVAQRSGVARALIESAFEHLRSANMKIVMVETGDDPGHAASRETYERLGFERWPVARYFREL